MESSMNDQHTDPAADGVARLAQLAAMSVSVGEALARLRAHRLHERAADDERRAAGDRAHRDLAGVRERMTYAPLMDNLHLRGLSTSQILGAWSAAVPPAEHDPLAARARDRAEQRLRQLHPEAMATFDVAQDQGLDPFTAMRRAAGEFRGEYGLDSLGTPVAAVATAEWGRAAAAQATPDLRSTPRVDETHLAGADTARHAGLAVVAQAFPADIRRTMASAPAAATSMRALPSTPHRAQLTAVRTPDPPIRH
jgi:hypothetical protein